MSYDPPERTKPNDAPIPNMHHHARKQKAEPEFDPFGPPPEGEGVVITGTIPADDEPRADPELEKAITQAFDYLCQRHDKAVSARSASVRVNRAELYLVLATFKGIMASQQTVNVDFNAMSATRPEIGE